MSCYRNRIPGVMLFVLGIALIAAPSFLGSKSAGANAGEPLALGQRSSSDAILAKAYRFERGGWIYVHLEGSPHDIGYQHGYLLAPEIADAYSAVSLEMTHSSNRDWDFFRRASRQMLWPKIDPEYQAELRGIVEGLQAAKVKLDLEDIVAMNAFMELSDYYVPWLDEQTKALHRDKPDLSAPPLKERPRTGHIGFQDLCRDGDRRSIPGDTRRRDRFRASSERLRRPGTDEVFAKPRVVVFVVEPVAREVVPCLAVEDILLH